MGFPVGLARAAPRPESPRVELLGRLGSAVRLDFFFLAVLAFLPKGTLACSLTSAKSLGLIFF